MEEPHHFLLGQAWCYFDLGIGPEIGKRLKQDAWSFEAYLRTLPAPCLDCIAEAEASLAGPATGHFLYFLVDPRAGLVFPCRVGKIFYRGDDTTFVPWKGEPIEKPYWVLLHPGEAYLRKSPGRARREMLRARQFPASAIEGVFARFHHLEVVTEHGRNPLGRAMYLPASVHHKYRAYSSWLEFREGRAELCWEVPGMGGRSQYGVAFRRECTHVVR